MLEIRNLKKSFGDLDVLNINSLEVNDNEVVGFIGRNGTGKTTLFKILLSLLKPDKAKTLNIDYTKTGLIEQPGFYPGLSGYENLKFLLSKAAMEEAGTIINMMGVRSYIHRPVRKYSLGMKQRLALTYLFSCDSALILLDEPTVALDDQGIEAFRNALFHAKSKGKTILISSHEIHHVMNLCDRFLLLKDGDLHPIDIARSSEYHIYVMHFNTEHDAMKAVATYDLKHDIIDGGCIRVYMKKDIKPLIKKLVDYQLTAFYKVEDVSVFFNHTSGFGGLIK